MCWIEDRRKSLACGISKSKDHYDYLINHKSGPGDLVTCVKREAVRKSSDASYLGIEAYCDIQSDGE